MLRLASFNFNPSWLYVIGVYPISANPFPELVGDSIPGISRSMGSPPFGGIIIGGHACVPGLTKQHCTGGLVLLQAPQTLTK